MRDEYSDWSESKKDPSERAHIDFPANLAYARKFCETCMPRLKMGMRAKVCDSQDLKNALLTISWRPPPDAKRGNYADSIFLHQARSQVIGQVEQVFERYIRMVNYWEGRQKAEGF